jgi:hypothetical protein
MVVGFPTDLAVKNLTTLVRKSTSDWWNARIEEKVYPVKHKHCERVAINGCVTLRSGSVVRSQLDPRRLGADRGHHGWSKTDAYLTINVLRVYTVVMIGPGRGCR